MCLQPEVAAGTASVPLNVWLVEIVEASFAPVTALAVIFAVPTEPSGGVVVTRPTYLPSSGIVVGEHPSWSGRGAYSGGIPDGPQEAIIPLHEASEFIDPMGRSVAGAVLNQMAMEGSMMRNGGGGGMSTVPVVMDNSTTIQKKNTTINAQIKTM